MIFSILLWVAFSSLLSRVSSGLSWSRSFCSMVFWTTSFITSSVSDCRHIFRALFSKAYPINSIRLVDDFDASDEASMQANNTSCFNYRTVARSKTLSKHALGLAVDINPLENPYVKGSFIQPCTATNYVDRKKDFPHKIDEDDFCKEVFESFGFQWGGYWRSVKDYQHFEKRK